MDHYLGTHPQVFMARKEMHFFGSDLCFQRNFYRRDLNAYLGEFSAANGARRVGETSVWYLQSVKAAAEIKAFNPQARILIMLRRPADLLYSLYNEFRYEGSEDLPSFEQALAAEPDRRAGQRCSRRACFRHGLLYREVAKFTQQVRRYFDAFGRERVHVVLYEEFAADPARNYREILEFLNLVGVLPENGFGVVNGGNRRVRSHVLWALLTEPIIRSILITGRPILPNPVFRALRRAELLLWRANTAPAKQPLQAPELRSRLDQEFAAETEKLSELLNKDLTGWTR